MPARPVPTIALSDARSIVDSALDFARLRDFPPITIVVLDASAQLVMFVREDGCSLFSERIARGKACGAVSLGVSSRSLANLATIRPAFVDSLITVAEGQLILGPGGVLILDDLGHLVGAVGVSGHLPEEDEACALSAIASAGLNPGVES